MADEAWDRAMINDVLARYADGVNRRDAALWGSTWHAEAQWYLFDPEPTTGRDAIVAKWEREIAEYPRAMMFVTQGQVVLDGDRATGKSYNIEVGGTKDGRNIRMYSSYDDIYARRDGVWAFVSRRFTLHHLEEY